MKKQHRNIVFIIFITLFILSIPITLLYTGGYRYNIQKNKLERTGNFFVDIKTKDIILQIDGKKQEIKDEYRVKNILPGEYNITLSKPGYFNWQKKLQVESEITTFIEDVRLFKKSVPENVINLPISKFYPSPDNERILYSLYNNKQKQYNIYLLDFDNESVKQILSLKSSPEKIVWSPDGYKFFAKTASGFILADRRTGKIDTSFIDIDPNNLTWHEKNSYVLYAKEKNKIFKIDLFFNETSGVYKNTENIQDFLVHENNLYYINKYNLEQIDLKTGERVYIPLERSGYKINSIKNSKLYLIHPQKNKLQIFNLSLNSLSTPLLLANAKDFDFFGDNLLYYNDFELWMYNFNNNSKELITRIGQNIKKARLLSGTNYITYLIGNKIRIIEIDKRDKRQSWELANFDNIYDLAIFDNSFLYFIGTINSQKGIYKLEI